MFGSFAAEAERPVYGLTKNISTYNPLRVATHEYAAIARDIRAADTWSERAGRVFRGPGWQPAAKAAAKVAAAPVVAAPATHAPAVPVTPGAAAPAPASVPAAPAPVQAKAPAPEPAP